MASQGPADSQNSCHPATATCRPNFGDPLKGHLRYRKLEDLSRGSYGFVQKCRSLETGEDVAIKFLDRGQDTITRYVEREVLNQASVCHPHIVGFREVFCVKTHLAIVMEFVPGGNVLQHILKKEGLTENEARRIFQQLIIGVDFMHGKGIVNRDIKLDNTMLDLSTKPLVKITDLGLSKSVEDSAPKSLVGTPAYMAPEVMTGHHYSGQAADSWSCGIMLYAMLFRTYPFPELTGQSSRSDFEEAYRKKWTMDYYFPAGTGVSGLAMDLISRILIPNPAARLTVAQIQEHPWFQVGLPRGVKEMNERFAKDDPHAQHGYQSVEVIKGVIALARMEDPIFEAAPSSNTSPSTVSEQTNQTNQSVCYPVWQMHNPSNRQDRRVLV